MASKLVRDLMLDETNQLVADIGLSVFLEGGGKSPGFALQAAVEFVRELATNGLPVPTAHKPKNP